MVRKVLRVNQTSSSIKVTEVEGEEVITETEVITEAEVNIEDEETVEEVVADQ